MKKRGWIVLGVVLGFWILLLVGLAAFAVGSVGSSGSSEWQEKVVRGNGDQKIAMIRVSGVISGGSSGGGLLSGATAGADDLVSQLRQADDDPDVAAIMLRLDTPGGDVVASDDVYNEVRRVNAHKPVIASMGSLAASGGYYISAATRRIVASPATLTGSIGVIMMLPNVAEAAQKVGIKPVVLKSGAFKDAGSLFRDLKPEEQAYFQKIIDEAYEEFVTAVAKGRNRTPEEIRALADGRVYTGLQAKANGLVDELGDQDHAYKTALRLADLDEKEARLVSYEKPAGLGSLFAPSFKSPAKQVTEDLGLAFGLKYLYLQ